MYICMYVCIYIYIYMCLFIYLFSSRFKADFKDMKPAASNAGGGGADASLQPMPRGGCSPIDERGGSKSSCFLWDAEEHRLV